MQNYIPFQLRTLITQIDPALDTFWRENLTEIFQTISDENKKNIQQQILRTKGITWNTTSNTFHYSTDNNLESLSTIITHSGMKHLIQKIIASFEQLKKYEDAHKVADYLESVITQIDNIDTEESVHLQIEKNKIRTAFIYTTAQIIRETTYLKTPKNHRALDVEVIKCFINEVYLKQQLLGYWFKTLRPRQLATEKHPLLTHFLKPEQRTRQLEVIKTSKYLFALAPSRDRDINPFSIRRFLQEESLAFSGNIYLNGSVLNLELMNQPEHNEHFQWQISRIVTIEKQISEYIINLVDQFEQYNANHLVPLLFAELDSSGLMIEKVIQQRLWDFEQNLSIHVLEPLEHALKNVVNHQDECDYLYVSIRQLIADIVSYFKDFQSQPAIMFDNQADKFGARLIGYLKLLEKRQLDTFTLMQNSDWAEKHEQMQEPLRLLKTTSKDGLQEYKDLQLKIKQAQRSLNEQGKSFLGKLFNKSKGLEQEITTLKEKSFTLRENAYVDIVRIPKQHAQRTVYLEFESLISINSKERHYAFPIGENGLTRLPILVQLPEDRTLFSLQDICNSLEFDLSKVNQKWKAAS